MHEAASPDEITLLLHRMSHGDGGAGERLFTLLYNDLHRRAVACLRGLPPGHTLQATALVNEAYLRLAAGPEGGWQSRGHFLCTAARAMRSILVDHARRKGRAKRGDAIEPEPLDHVVLAFEARSTDLLDLDEALREFEARDPRAAQVVTLRFFGGRTTAETADALCVSVSTVEREWDVARAWLRRRLG